MGLFFWWGSWVVKLVLYLQRVLWNFPQVLTAKNTLSTFSLPLCRVWGGGGSQSTHTIARTDQLFASDSHSFVADWLQWHSVEWEVWYRVQGGVSGGGHQDEGGRGWDAALYTLECADTWGTRRTTEMVVTYWQCVCVCGGSSYLKYWVNVEGWIETAR